MRAVGTSFVALALVGAGAGLAQETCPCPPPAPPPPLWTGSVGLSYLATSGNTDTESLGFAATWARQPTPWGMEITALANRAESDGVTTAERYYGGLRGKRALGEAFELFGGLSYESNEFAGFDSRTLVEAGGIWKALVGPVHEFAFDAGLTWTQEAPVVGEDLDFMGAVAGAAYAWKITDAATLRERLLYFPNFDTSDDWRWRRRLRSKRLSRPPGRCASATSTRATICRCPASRRPTARRPSRWSGSAEEGARRAQRSRAYLVVFRIDSAAQESHARWHPQACTTGGGARDGPGVQFPSGNGRRPWRPGVQTGSRGVSGDVEILCWSRWGADPRIRRWHGGRKMPSWPALRRFSDPPRSLQSGSRSLAIAGAPAVSAWRGYRLAGCGAGTEQGSRRIVVASPEVMKGFKMSKKLFLLGIAMMMMLVGGSAPAVAGQPHFEIFGGYLSGRRRCRQRHHLRCPLRRSSGEVFGWQVSTSLFDANGDVAPAGLDPFIGDVNVWLVDASIQWFPGGGNFALFGGLGFATVDVDIVGTPPDVSDDSLTYHAGVSYLWQVGEKFYVRPDVRVRDFDGDLYDNLDTEAAIGFGWNF